MVAYPTSEDTRPQPSTADLMDCIRDCAENLSDAIKAANQAGISVSIQASQVPTGALFTIVYSF